MVVVEVCRAYKWDFYTYLAQPAWFLDLIIEKIRLKHYNVLICFSVDRFSRKSPSKINALLDNIVEL